MNIRRLFILFIGLIGIVNCFGQRPISTDALFNVSETFAENNREENLIHSKYDARQKLESDNEIVRIEGKFDLAQIYLKEGKAGKAKTIIEEYPKHPKASTTSLALGNYFLKKNKLDLALVYLKIVKKEGLKKADYIASRFKLGYVLLLKKKYSESIGYFKTASRFSNFYKIPAKYYQAFALLKLDNVSEALVLLNEIENDEIFGEQVKLLKLKVLLKTNQYKEALAYINQIKSSINHSLKYELYISQGEAHFQLKDYEKAAASYSKAQVGTNNSADQNYKIGYSFYEVHEYKKAAQYFKKIDENAAPAILNASIFYLAQIDLFYGNIMQGKQKLLALQGKTIVDSNLRFQVNILLSKILLNEGSFQEATELLISMLKNFPPDQNLNQVKELLSGGINKIPNKQKALEYLEKFSLNNTFLQKAYQEITYTMGEKFYRQKKYEIALEYLNKSYQANISSIYKYKSHYLIAELLSETQRDVGAINHYLEVIDAKKITLPLEEDELSKLKKGAYYGLAYAYFNTEQYDHAAKCFSKALSKFNYDKPTTVDINTRLADTKYTFKQYDEAKLKYKPLLKSPYSDIIHIKYQLGLINIVEDDQESAIRNLSYVQKNAKDETLRSKAFLASAEMYLQNGQYNDAINVLKKSSTNSEQLFKLGLAYANSNQDDLAVQNYTKVIQDYTKSEEALSALSNVRTILFQQGKAEEYNALEEVYKENNSGSSNLKQIALDKALTFFNNEDYQQAINSFSTYLNNYKAENIESIYNYLAISYMKIDDYTNALAEIMKISTLSDKQNLMVGDIHSKQRNYKKSNEFYKKVLENNSSTAYKKAALNGLLFNAIQLQNLQEILSYVNQLERIQPSNELIFEGLFEVARIYIIRSEYDRAFQEYDHIISLDKKNNGGKAYYNQVKLYYDQEKYNKCIKYAKKFNNTIKGQSFWKAKSFLLIAQSYQKLDNNFQAKAVLNSLIKHASNEDVVNEAKHLLNELEKTDDNVE